MSHLHSEHPEMAEPLGDTPRTNAFLENALSAIHETETIEDFTRQLERENAALREQLAERDAEIAALKGHAEAMADDLDMFAAQPDYDGPLYGPMPSLIAYRADFPEEK